MLEGRKRTNGYIFNYAAGMIYAPTDPSEELLKMLPFRNTIIKLVPTNIGYQEGTVVQAMIDPFLDKNVSWFDNYDWVIKLNTDEGIVNSFRDGDGNNGLLAVENPDILNVGGYVL